MYPCSPVPALPLAWASGTTSVLVLLLLCSLCELSGLCWSTPLKSVCIRMSMGPVGLNTSSQFETFPHVSALSLYLDHGRPINRSWCSFLLAHLETPCPRQQYCSIRGGTGDETYLPPLSKFTSHVSSQLSLSAFYNCSSLSCPSIAWKRRPLPTPSF